MIDWREVQATTVRAVDQFGGVYDVHVGPSVDAFFDALRFDYITWLYVESAYAIGAWARYDGAQAAEHWARAEAFGAGVREIDEMRRGWRDLDRWVDDGGRA